MEQTPEDANLTQAAVAEVERYRNMDRLIPSANNVVTVACLEVQIIYLIFTLPLTVLLLTVLSFAHHG